MTRDIEQTKKNVEQLNAKQKSKRRKREKYYEIIFNKKRNKRQKTDQRPTLDTNDDCPGSVPVGSRLELRCSYD